MSRTFSEPERRSAHQRGRPGGRFSGFSLQYRRSVYSNGWFTEHRSVNWFTLPAKCKPVFQVYLETPPIARTGDAGSCEILRYYQNSWSDATRKVGNSRQKTVFSAETARLDAGNAHQQKVLDFSGGSCILALVPKTSQECTTPERLQRPVYGIRVFG